MAHVCTPLDSFSSYRDSRSQLSYSDQQAQLTRSATLYVGNLSFYTTEEQIYELFGKVGNIKRIIMGLDRNSKTPCGFCFVEYYAHFDALEALRFISGTKLDERIIRADMDPGYQEGRQYGRGRSGGQVRDEYRADYDAGRGGWGHLRARQEIEAEQERLEREGMIRLQEQEQLYRLDHDDLGEGKGWGGQREVPEGGAEAQGNPRFRQERDENENENEDYY